MATFQRSAVLEWNGDIPRGAGRVAASSGAFETGATFPRLAGDPEGTTTPEELLAASHAVCFGIALRSVLAQRRAAAVSIRATSTITAEKAGGRIGVVAAHVEAVVEGLAGLDGEGLEDAARTAEEQCTISALLRQTVQVTVSVHQRTR